MVDDRSTATQPPVEQRTGGAKSRRQLVLGVGLGLVLVGVAIGAVVAMLLSRGGESVEATDASQPNDAVEAEADSATEAELSTDTEQSTSTTEQITSTTEQSSTTEQATSTTEPPLAFAGATRRPVTDVLDRRLGQSNAILEILERSIRVAVAGQEIWYTTPSEELVGLVVSGDSVDERRIDLPGASYDLAIAEDHIYVGNIYGAELYRVDRRDFTVETVPLGYQPWYLNASAGEVVVGTNGPTVLYLDDSTGAVSRFETLSDALYLLQAYRYDRDTIVTSHDPPELVRLTDAGEVTARVALPIFAFESCPSGANIAVVAKQSLLTVNPDLELIDEARQPESLRSIACHRDKVAAVAEDPGMVRLFEITATGTIVPVDSISRPGRVSAVAFLESGDLVIVG